MTPKELKERIKLRYAGLKDDLLNYDSFHTVTEVSRFYDSIILEEFSFIKGKSDFCVIAGGSYSYSELCPYSDIDIMIITADGLNQESVAKCLKDFFYLFWDAGIDLAQIVMTVSEAVGLTGKDFNTYTSFSNARYLCGNADLFLEFNKGFSKIDANSIFLVELMKSLRRRRLINVMADNDIFLLEPDVKEGFGGLRDYSYCEWVYRIAGDSGKKQLDINGSAGNIQKIDPDIKSYLKFLRSGSSLDLSDLDAMREGKKFILKVRIIMHLIAQKKSDKLTFDVQERVANALYYKDGKFLNKIEYFMHDYYLNVKNMHRVSKLVISLMIRPKLLNSGKFLKDRIEISPLVSSCMGIRGASEESEKNLIDEEGMVTVRDKDLFLSDPRNIFNLLGVYLSSGRRLSMESINLLKIAGEKYKKIIMNADFAGEFFTGLLKCKKRVYQTLLLMHETRLLSALIPEFDKIDSLSTNDVYHVYTVDAHSLNGIHYLEDMVNFKINRELKATFEELTAEDMLILNFSLLLHDIGKGYSSHHESIGSKIAVKVADRLGFSESVSNCVEFLILNHFLLPLTSERRDIHDPSTIKYAAGIVKDVRHLRFLFIVSICDSMAVSKTRFNSWRKMLLVELYERTLSFLENSEGYFKSDLFYINEIYELAMKMQDKKGYNFLKGKDREGLKRLIVDFVDKFYSPIKYLTRETSEDVLLHLKLFSKISSGHRFNFVAKAHMEEDYYEIIICGEDKKTIFSDIAGVLSYFDFNILSADINTRKDGKFIDSFFVNHTYKKVDGNIDWHRLRNTFFKVFNGKASLLDMFGAKIKNETLYKKKGPKVSSSVEIYNGLSQEFTVIEIQALDRKGLLYDIGIIFNRFNLSVFVSKITTQGNKAFDTFYVKNDSGKKIRNLLTIRKIKQAVINEL